MKKNLVLLACASALVLPATVHAAPKPPASASSATAAKPQLTFEQKLSLFLFGSLATGQPSVECGDDDALNRPGHAENAPGSAFNPDGNAGEHYAGEQPQNSRNPKSVSQYDVACAHAQSPQ